ncbi:MAG: acetylglutamate kinase [Phycisphaerales bacterium]
MSVIVKISGKPVSDPVASEALWPQLALAFAASPFVIVHGGGVQVDELMHRLGEPIDRRDGIRLTPASQIGLVAGVLAGQVSTRIVALLRRAGAPAVGLSLASSGTVEAAVDPSVGGRVGRVTGGDGALVTLLLNKGYLPVLSSIGCAADGELLNINADDAAAGVAMAIGAGRVVLLTDVAGVEDAMGSTVAALNDTHAEELIAAGVVTGGMIAKVRSAVALSAATGVPVLVASWRDADAAIRGDSGVGTLVQAEHRSSQKGQTR